MYQVEENNALATSFPAFHSIGKHNHQTRSATQNLLDVPLARGKFHIKVRRAWNPPFQILMKFGAYVSPFQGWRAMARARTHTRAKVFRRVINSTRKWKFWLHVYTT